MSEPKWKAIGEIYNDEGQRMAVGADVQSRNYPSTCRECGRPKRTRVELLWGSLPPCRLDREDAISLARLLETAADQTTDA
jgi:hypothetical protein